MKIREVFKKQGGKKLILQYWKSGALFTAISEFVLLGKSRTSLEILRLSTTLKTKQKLEKKYRSVLEKFDQGWQEKHQKKGNYIWICWFQGIENAPEIVKVCYRSVVMNNPDKEIIVITKENMYEYVDFPDYVREKWERGIITNTHMTDLLRLELLIRYGGMWIDATVLCTSNSIPDYFFESDLFFFQCLKPGRDGHSTYISSWLISAKTNNKILSAVQNLCYAYWEKNTVMCDYFLMHDFFSIVLDKYMEDWNKVIPRDNATPHILLLRMFEEYNENVWNAIVNQTPFHKLTYKFSEDDIKKNNTYYEAICNYVEEYTI